MKKVILTIGLIVMFSGCAATEQPAPSSTGNAAFDLGQKLGHAIADKLWGDN
jgi:PBP1b-binding outer membrane lipoprotein LpoB